MCVCPPSHDCISFGNEGNALYPVLFSSQASATAAIWYFGKKQVIPENTRQTAYNALSFHLLGGPGFNFGGPENFRQKTGRARLWFLGMCKARVTTNMAPGIN